MKILIGIGFLLFALSLAISLAGDYRALTPSSIFGGSSLIAFAIYSKK
jgi:hypothetical protein